MSFGYYKPAMGVPSGSRQTSSTLPRDENRRMAERNKREDIYDPITGVPRSYAAPAPQLDKDLTPSSEPPPATRGAINPGRNASMVGLIRHDIPLEAEVVGSVSRVTESCLQSTLIPAGDETELPPGKPLLRRAGGECAGYVIPQDKLGPGLTSSERPARNMRSHVATAFGRSQLRQTPFGIMAFDDSSTADLPALPQRLVDDDQGGYVRIYGRS
eukprot:GEMP01086975.1.p1 GENE.GEMP01086975.1~~GEMP01086975.1.p1  ORF type:complete len:215 (+),score=45.22 GEMP01086975.1:41-685(+)